MLSRANCSVTDGCQQMWAERGSEGQEWVTVWEGGQLEGDPSSGQSEWQGTRIPQSKHLDEYCFYFIHDPQQLEDHLENNFPFLG